LINSLAGVSDIFNTVFFSKFGTMKPERLLTDVLDVKTPSATTFQLEVKEEGVVKNIDYEVADKNIATKIVAKIRYLK